jgi:predicted hydrocarbon binding protein
MLATSHDLPLRGNYFAETEYLDQDLNSGTLRNRAGARMLALTDECFIALHNVMADEFGARSEGVLKAFGGDWGRQAAQQFVAETARHHDRASTELPLAVFSADLTAAFLHHGWGRFQFDFGRYSHGIIGVDVHEPFVGSVVKSAGRLVEPLLAGFLAGMFSQLAGITLECLQTECRANGAAVSRFLLTVPERLAAVTPLTLEQKPHGEIVAALEKTQAAQ